MFIVGYFESYIVIAKCGDDLNTCRKAFYMCLDVIEDRLTAYDPKGFLDNSQQ